MGIFGGGGHSNDNAPTNYAQLANDKISKQQWADYKQRFVPNENNYIKKVQSLRKESGLAQSRAAGDTAQAYAPAKESAKRASFAHGVNPNSGAFTLEQGQLNSAQATTGAKGLEGAVQSSQDRFLAGLQKVVSYGRGLADDAQVGFRNAAINVSRSTKQDAEYQNQVQRNKWDAVGTIAGGAAAGLGGAWGQVGIGDVSQWGQNTWSDPFAGPRKLHD